MYKSYCLVSVEVMFQQQIYVKILRRSWLFLFKFSVSQGTWCCLLTSLSSYFSQILWWWSEILLHVSQNNSVQHRVEQHDQSFVSDFVPVLLQQGIHEVFKWRLKLRVVRLQDLEKTTVKRLTECVPWRLLMDLTLSTAWSFYASSIDMQTHKITWHII